MPILSAAADRAGITDAFEKLGLAELIGAPDSKTMLTLSLAMAALCMRALGSVRKLLEKIQGETCVASVLR